MSLSDIILIIIGALGLALLGIGLVFVGGYFLGKTDQLKEK